MGKVSSMPKAGPVERADATIQAPIGLTESDPEFLSSLGRRVRDAREQRGMARKALARDAQVSERQDVGPPQPEQQQHLHRPASHAPDGGEAFDDFLVAHLRHGASCWHRSVDGLGREILEEERIHCALKSDLELGDLAFGYYGKQPSLLDSTAWSLADR